MLQNFKSHSLVLYKTAPAIIDQVGDKISIQLANGKSVKVRPKDIQLLHPGPLKSLADLNQTPQGNVEEAWELLQGETVELTELAEFIYGEASPVTVWHAWQVLHAAIHFTGSREQITARTEAEVEAIVNKQREKEEEAARWKDYLQRVKDHTIQPEDFPHLSDLERMAYRKASTNRTLKALGIEVAPEKAHRLLLQLRLWNDAVNPYPTRFDCATTQPELEVPELPEEPREDLTALETFAIDDDNCSDPDDAISLDGECLWIHVADAAALIKADSPLDQEARARGANLYLPEIVINMLPSAVTSILGLGLQDISPALSFKIGIKEDGSPTCLKIIPSLIRVQRLSYSAADELMETSPFQEMNLIAEQFRKRRVAQGAARINLPEVKLKTTVDGELYNLAARHELGLKEPDDFSVEIKDLPRLKSREMVTDAMLMAGEAIAVYCIENEIPVPFACQPPPDESGTPETMAEMFAYRKKFKRSGLHLDPDWHSGLGLERYTRSTSPLRRYSDLLVHQQVRAFIGGQPLISEADMLERMSQAEIGGGNTAMAERRSNRHWTLLHMQQHPETVYRGVVVDKRDDRGVVMIPELAIDVKMRRMADVELDDEVELQLLQINLPELDFTCRMV
ncbi:RNB domain-containing ribonuclease [Pontiella sulfatireligans]|uniref:Ribonuclease R n=1 Tax=Pontiella sulfatireligans TaxID=2750658 RepID=A0A6C2ULY6_9BACT|nr:RNB domain-containing ribonuclease [Pontiella sulfatireligans]VGO21280.1 Ribonuclease R [Pontiella sulfatireligans]